MGAGLLQPTHIIFVIVIALLVFGPKRLPEMGRSLGRGMREFKDSISGKDDDHDHDRIELPPPREESTVTAKSPSAPSRERDTV